MLKEKELAEAIKAEKDKLLDDFLSIGGNHKPQESANAEKNIIEFAEKYGYDDDIQDVLQIRKIEIAVREGYFFKDYYHLAEDMLDRLIKKEQWHFFDLRILVGAIPHSFDLEQTLALSKRVFELLDKEYKDKPIYETAKVKFNVAISNNLMKLYYLNIKNSIYKEKVKKELLFHLESALEISSKETFPREYSVSLIKKGLLNNNTKLQKQGFSILAKLKEKEIVYLMKMGIEEYNFFVYNIEGELYINRKIGNRMRSQRKLNGLSLEEVADTIGVSYVTLYNAERGRTSLKAANLRKLADLLDVEVDFFFQFDDPETKDFTNPTLEKLSALIKTLDEGEQKMAIDMVKSIVKNRKK